MRYRLRTLMIAAAVLPPVLALAWFVAIWARYALPSVLPGIVRPIALAGMLGAVGLIAIIVAAPPARSQPAVTVSSQHLLTLAVLTVVALWQWLWVIGGLVGWIFVWGDNGPTALQRNLHVLFPPAIALICTFLMCLRIHAGWATINYVFLIWCFTVPLALFAALLWISLLLM
jgi:hypothetical protein